MWIHGGAFIRMFDYTGYPDTNNGSILAYHGDIIVVTVHYRLGIFGSLHTGDDRIRGGLVTQICVKYLTSTANDLCHQILCCSFPGRSHSFRLPNGCCFELKCRNIFATQETLA